jgi:hypothetical protein
MVSPAAMTPLKRLKDAKSVETSLGGIGASCRTDPIEN